MNLAAPSASAMPAACHAAWTGAGMKMLRPTEMIADGLDPSLPAITTTLGNWLSLNPLDNALA